ncbi:MAG TPA: alpha/beta hydrolase [Xanthobacteraceae bacterium]|nr:alpha/beta hydrolase [Xanthobacteraceae bacterium]
MPALPAQAQKQESLQVGGKQVTLHVPANARASAILIPGKGGVSPDDPLLRNRAALNAQGIATLTVPHGTVIGEAIKYMRTVKEPVGLVGMSAGVSFAGRAVGRGAKPDSVVLISGSLMPPGKLPAQQGIKSPSAMPRTLVLHNKNDACDLTPVSAVEPFVKWAGGRASLQWIGGSGGGKDPCGPNSAHGFMGADGQVVGAIVGFIAR